MCIHSPDNFSDHVPVFLELSISLPQVGGSDTLGLYGNTILHDNSDWCKIDSTSIEAYKICFQASLPTLSNELQFPQPRIASCINLLLTLHVKNCFSVCIMLDNNVFLGFVNVLRLCQDGMALLDDSILESFVVR